jgi:hypothetical protein
MNSLRPCPACLRHVRAAEARCPFCDAALAAVMMPSRAKAPRLGRAALIALGAAAATASLAVVACGSGTGPVYGDASASEGGGFGSDASDDAPDTSIPDTGNVAHPYGAPPADGVGLIV